MNDSRTCFFTIAARNYLPYVRTLFGSIREHCPEADLLLAVSDSAQGVDPVAEGCRVLTLKELDVGEPFIFQYTILELSTAIKPLVFRAIFNTGNHDRVVYLDPDIRLYSSPQEMLSRLNDHDALLTPHLTAPLEDGLSPDDLYILRAGSYNLGFVALRRTAATRRLIDWWARRLERDCVVDIGRGLFVDQKWMDLAPGFCDVRVCRDPGWNVAFWNLAHRDVKLKEGGRYLVNGEPLVFFHFSGFDQFAGTLSRHQDRFSLQSVSPAVRSLFDGYAVELQKSGIQEYQTVPYAYARTPSGIVIPDAARRYYRESRGRMEKMFPLPLTRDAEDYVAFLNEIETESCSSDLPLTRLACAIYRQHSDHLAAAFSSLEGAGGLGFAQWMLKFAPTSLTLDEYFIRPIREALHESTRVKTLPAPSLSTLLPRLLYRIAWLLRRQIAFFVDQATRQRVHALMFRAAFRSETREDLAPGWVAAGRKNDFLAHLPGINVVGYLCAESGVGEAARATICATTAARVPCSGIDFRKGPQCRMEESVEPGMQTGQRYGINLLHVNADQTLIVANDLAPEFFRSRYNIGFWNWELPECPNYFAEACAPLDEVWTPSDFVREAVSRHVPVPVITMPICVQPQRSVWEGAASALALPHGTFVFFFMFDTLSIPERKNPLATVEAFRRARDSFVRPALLAMKVTNSNRSSSPVLGELRRAAAAGDLLLVEQYWDRAQLSATLGRIGCYISLHRSEGYGLALAEAMFFGKPVIATGWSGNMEFMTRSNSCPVRSRIVELECDYGPYRQGSHWAEPDLDHAAEFMVAAVNDPEAAAEIGRRAAEDIRRDYSPEAAGNRLRTRLEAIRKKARSGTE